MYSLVVFALVNSLVAYHVTASENLCPLNEEWNECDTACPPSCENRTPLICTEQCIKRCSCIKGFVRERPGGRCVPLKSCNKLICDKPNEELSSCATQCPEICNQREPRICPAVCTTGCVCKSGYIRSELDGTCIPRDQCKPRCGLNERFTSCGTACPSICNQTLPKLCTLQCIQGCVCNEGFIRETKGGRCVPEVGCEPKCEENEEYSRCGSACAATCSEPVKRCNRICVKGCFCKKGHVRNGDGKCIKTEECPR